MTISDPIADMLTRIRNVAMVGKTTVAMPNSKLKSEVARILTEEGYLESYEVVDGKSDAHKVLRMKLKYIGERRQHVARLHRQEVFLRLLAERLLDGLWKRLVLQAFASKVVVHGCGTESKQQKKKKQQ